MNKVCFNLTAVLQDKLHISSKLLMPHIMTTLVLLLEAIHETGVHLTAVYACDPGREVGSVFTARNVLLCPSL